MPQLERRETVWHDYITSDQALDGKLLHARYHQLVGRLQTLQKAMPSVHILAFKWHGMMRALLKTKKNKRTKLPVGKEKRYVRAMRAIHMGGLEHPCVALISSKIIKEDRRRSPNFLPREDHETRPFRGLRKNRSGTLPVLFRYSNKNVALPRLKGTVAIGSTAERLDRKMPNVTIRRVLLQIIPHRVVFRETTEHISRKYTKMVCMTAIALADRSIPLCLAKYVMSFAFGRQPNEARSPFKAKLIYELLGKLYKRTKKRPYTNLASSIENIEAKDEVKRANARVDKKLAEACNFDSINSVCELETLSVEKLRVLCRVRKVVGYSGLRRAELIAHIKQCLDMKSDYDHGRHDDRNVDMLIATAKC